jgi:hypothetical protein
MRKRFKALVDFAVTRFGALHVMFNNARAKALAQ